MSRTKRKASDARAPADAAEASDFLSRIGELQRAIGMVQLRLDAQVTALKEAADAEAKPLAAEEDRLTRGLQLWAEANREALTQGGKVKTVKLPAGEIAWRHRPPGVRVRDAASVLVELGKLGLARFIRRKEEIDKEAMLREPAVAGTVPGITIGSAGEEFVVSPVVVPLTANSGPALDAPVGAR